LASINLTVLSSLPVPICSHKEQEKVVQEIESRLSVADNLEETISNSLQQAEVLRQSILKKAFEGQI
jgi:type I restriction enzyme S subunit